jgi:hypothetical protein
MRRATVSLRLCCVALAAILVISGVLSAQVKDGDFIISQLLNTPTTFGGYTITVDPRTGAWSTVSPPVSGYLYSWVRMDTDNLHVMNALVDSVFFFDGAMVRSDTSGSLTTLALIQPTSTVSAQLNGFELDYTGEWILAAPQALWSVDASTGKTVSLFVGGVPGLWNELAIDRDPGAPPFVVANFTQLTSPVVKLFGTDRKGTITTILASTGDPLQQVAGVELWCETGQYLTCDFAAPQVHLVNKDGSIASSIAVMGTNGAKINLDGTAWIVAPSEVSRVDLRKGAVTSIVKVNAGPQNAFSFTGIDTYGSRRMVCLGSGRPGTSVRVSLSSRKPVDAGKPYLLAASFGRRPALGFGTGEMLCLAPDPLLFVSAGQNNAIFQGFFGTTDAKGEATAAVNIPKSLPPGLGITVFVAGVIFDATFRVQTVTNTHWFVLS